MRYAELIEQAKEKTNKEKRREHSFVSPRVPIYPHKKYKRDKNEREREREREREGKIKKKKNSLFLTSMDFPIREKNSGTFDVLASQ